MYLLNYAVLLFFFIVVSGTAYSRQVIEISAVEGKIVDEETQHPVRGAAVLMTWGLRVLTFPQSRSGGYIYIAQAMTDDLGKFRLVPSNAIDLPKSTHDVELGDAHLWVLQEGFRTRIDKVPFRVIKKGFLFFSRSDSATVDEKLVIPLKASADARAEFFDIAALMRIGRFVDDKNACNDPMLGKFIYRAVKRQSTLRNQIIDIPDNLFKIVECNGNLFEFYPYSS